MNIQQEFMKTYSSVAHFKYLYNSHYSKTHSFVVTLHIKECPFSQNNYTFLYNKK